MKLESEKLLLDVDGDEDAVDADKEKGVDLSQQILLRDNIGASVVAPEQEDFNKTGVVMKMGSREISEIELVD